MKILWNNIALTVGLILLVGLVRVVLHTISSDEFFYAIVPAATDQGLARYMVSFEFIVVALLNAVIILKNP